MKLPRSSKGFTLIELLVVISIIAVLASLAVPAVTGALVKGQLIQAMSNARQIHMATMSMATDGSSTGDSMLQWPGDLAVATGSAQITNMTTFVTRLVTYDYLKVGDLKIFSTAGITPFNGTTASDFTDKNSAFKLYLVKDTDPSNTLFLGTKNYTYNKAFDETSSKLKPFGDKGFVVFRKGGDASILKKQQATGESIVQIVGNVPGTDDPTKPGTESPGATGNCFQVGQ